MLESDVNYAAVCQGIVCKYLFGEINFDKKFSL